MTKNRNEIGVYVLSFDMKYPMGFWEEKPWSPSFISNQMLKIGKTRKYTHRMKEYEHTYGFRASEPELPDVIDYYAKKGITDLNFNKCNGCDSREPHHHVKQEYFRSTGLMFSDEMAEDINKGIEEYIGEVFKEHKLKGFNNKGRVREYYCKSQLQNIIKEIDCFIEEKEKEIK